MQSIQTLGGVDVSAKRLSARRWRAGREDEKEFSNDAGGHGDLIRWLGKQARVCVEATGVYHLQLALALRRAGVELMIVNPRVAKDFARALSNRSKTDEVDARMLLEYVRRMEFQPWEPPSEAVLQLRELSRRITELVRAGVEEKNRLHAREVAGMSRAVVSDIKKNIAQLQKRVGLIEQEALRVVGSDVDLLEQFNILVGVRGIGQRTALLLLGELAVLDRAMTERQLVAYAGMDPRVYESGSSVQRPVRISKVGNARLRAILYMTGLSAVRYDRGARAFYSRLVARGKKPMQALVAVMRKLLHGIWVVLQRRIQFDSSVLFGTALAQAESIDSAVAADQPEPIQDHPKDRSEAKERRQPLDPGSAEATPRRNRTKRAA